MHRLQSSSHSTHPLLSALLMSSSRGAGCGGGGGVLIESIATVLSRKRWLAAHLVRETQEDHSVSKKACTVMVPNARAFDCHNSAITLLSSLVPLNLVFVKLVMQL